MVLGYNMSMNGMNSDFRFKDILKVEIFSKKTLFQVKIDLKNDEICGMMILID